MAAIFVKIRQANLKLAHKVRYHLKLFSAFFKFCLRFVICYVGESVGEITGEKAINSCHFDLSINDDTLIVVKYDTHSLQCYQLNFDQE